MKGYTEQYFFLNDIFRSGESEIKIPGSGIEIRNPEFHSERVKEIFINKNDISIQENYSFSYPVFVPRDKNSRKVILLLHGLNERSWEKYLVWAYTLCERTGSYVVLFPISFHINRSPGSWKDPRVMFSRMAERKSSFTDLNMTSVANIALSNRLTEDPKRFVNSGYQTVNDIVKLLSDIRNGSDGVIPSGSEINIFAYSIGAFLAQILMMGNPENLFDRSRLYIFCGGSVFSNMHGTSKLIMDSLAYDRVFSYYLDDFEKEIKNRKQFLDFLFNSKIGIAFRSMIDFSRFRKFRESRLSALKGQIKAATLVRDTVIPVDGIVRTLNYKSQEFDRMVRKLDFPYPYSHENPFPVFKNNLSKLVDSCFDSLFTEASLFLA